MNYLLFTLKLRRYVSTRQRDGHALRYWKDSMLLPKKGAKVLLFVHPSVNAFPSPLSRRSMMLLWVQKASQDDSAEETASAFPFKVIASFPRMR